MVELGLCPSREKAQARIMAGEVLVDDVPCTKAGTKIKPESEIRLKGDACPYVGRGGEKLKGAIDFFKVDLKDKIGLDIGASTGGFTDCLLQEGVSRVYAVDVGTNQLAHKLRVDTRVDCYEKTHVKDLESLELDPKPNLVVVDVSFISLKKVIPFIIPVISSSSILLVLVKPQFELSPQKIGKGGIVKSEQDALDVIEDMRTFLQSSSLEVLGVKESILKGRKSGNQEYFMLLRTVETIF
ncbi:MAG: TlyA family RNA methyltransferase [Saprospiraceae bacterium]|nr:TlyA family RNA methyltransferase [Saprospiraceae bacterium]